MYERAMYATQQSTAPATLLRTGDPITRKVTLLAGQIYPLGAVLGTITATKKATLSLAAASDGSQEPSFVLPYAVDATAGDAEAVVYEHADVIGEALVLGAGHTIASIRDILRDKGITIAA